MNTIANREAERQLVIGHIKSGVSDILKTYMYQPNTTDTITNMQHDVREYLTDQVDGGMIQQFVDTIQDGDSPNIIKVEIAYQPYFAVTFEEPYNPQDNESFIYSIFKVELVNSIEHDLASALAEEIQKEIDNEIMQSMVDTAYKEGLEQISTILAMPSDSVDDLADMFDEISDEEFMDLIEVITENNDEYNKAQDDEAYKRAMGIL